MLKLSAAVLGLAVTAAPAAPQTPPTGQRFTLSGNMLRGYAGLQRNLQEAAALMPEEHHSFKPTRETRPYRQRVAHIALSQFGGCAALTGEPTPRANEKHETSRSKADLVALMRAPTAYCDLVLKGLTDEAMVQSITVGPNQAAPPQKKGGEPRDVVEQFFAAYRARDVGAIATLMAADVVFEDPTFRQHRTGRDGIRILAAEMRAALNEVTIDVHSMVIAGEMVATEQTLGGVLTRPDGVKRRIKVRGSSFFRIRDGRIHTWTDYFDFRTFTEQTGHGI